MPATDGPKPSRRSIMVRFAALALLSLAFAPAGKSHRSLRDNLPPHSTPCDAGIPISIELIPLNQPAVGQPLRFRVQVDSGLDPDLVRDILLSYDIPGRVRRIFPAAAASRFLRKSGRSETDLGVVLPDGARYPIKARVVVRLADGKVLSQTAVYWAGVNGEDAPPEMTGRIVRPDGTGIRVYRGRTIKETR